MKGNFWKRIFRNGYDTKNARFNGYCAKTDANTSRTKLNRFLDKLSEEEVGVAESPAKTFPRVNEFDCGSSYRH